ncbi:NAD-dependent epimerase/dehydratase family protein [Ferrovibrio xuzhouensis]|uniref:NAD-dependent epimerase/dehydratase family protein n=1 Tax=Ferrovibrio xuzhouensis TaxID=1576914 RepID=A0ABV7VCR2_9PROT
MLNHGRQEPVKPERVAVIGAKGFVGRRLASLLAETAIPCLALSSADIDLSTTGAADRLAQQLRPTDAVVMLAALTPDKGRGIGPLESNIRMMAAVCAACEAVPPAHLVYISSDAVYPMQDGPISEATPAEPTDLYATMHITRELMAKTAAKSPVAVLRPTLIYGAEDTHNSYGPNRLRRMALKDSRVTLFGEGEETRDHISVDDVCRLILLTLQHRSQGLLNLATGHSISYMDLARKVAGLFDTPVDIITTPRQNLVTRRHFDVSALHRAFPDFAFEPLDTGLKNAHLGMMATQN